MGGVNALGPIHSSPILASPDAFASSLLETTTLEEVLATFGPLKKRRLEAYLRVRGRETAWLKNLVPEVTALRRAAKANDAQALLAARDRLLRKLIRLPDRIHSSRFAPTSQVMARISELLSAAARQKPMPPESCRAERLHISPNIGGGSIPIRPGVSHTIPLRAERAPRVLFISLFPPWSNGSGTYTQAMAEHIQQHGGEARVLFLGTDFDPTLTVPHYVVPFTAQDRNHLPGAAPVRLPVFASNPAAGTSARRFQDLSQAELAAYTDGLSDAVFEAARHFQPDILVVNHAWVGAEAARRTRLPYMVTCHGTCVGSVEEALQPGSPYPENVANLVLPGVQAADRVIAIMDDLEEPIRRVYGLSEGRVEIIRNGFHSDIFYPRDSLERGAVLFALGSEAEGASHLVSFAGRMVEYRGLATLFDSVPLVLAELPDVHFVLAGDGQDRLLFEAMAQEQRIDHRVHFVGHRFKHELADLHAVADLGVVPTYRDAFGIGALEMAGVGTPVIASDVGGLHYIVSEEMGIRVPPREPQALAAAITHSLRTDLKTKLGPQAARYAHENFPWSRTGGKLWTTIRAVLAQHRHPQPQRSTEVAAHP